MKSMFIFGLIGLSLALAGCDERANSIPVVPAPAQSPVESASLTRASLTHQDPPVAAPMPSSQQKRALLAQVDPRQPLVSPFMSAAEALEAKGYLLQFLESPSGSAAERQAWQGFTRYQALVQTRTEAAQERENIAASDHAAQVARDEPEARAICTRFRSNPYGFSYEEVSQMNARMEQLATAYPGDLSQCRVALRFQYLEQMPQVCTSAPC